MIKLNIQYHFTTVVYRLKDNLLRISHDTSFVAVDTTWSMQAALVVGLKRS